MEHTNTTSILINVAVQIVNLVIFFWIFKRFFGGKIMDWVRARNELIEKIKHAESEYEKIVSDAKHQSETIVQEALMHKTHILTEAEQLASMEKQKIIDQATKKSEDIIKNAELQSERLKTELEENWATWVKNTAKVLVKKLIHSNPDLQDKYIDSLLDEVKSK